MKRKTKEGVKAKNRIVKGKSKSNPLIGRIISGILDLTRSGVGYVVTEKSTTDIFIPKGEIGNALGGDRVSVKITYVSKAGKPEGTIIGVLQRSQSDFIGTLEMSENFGFVVPDNEKINFDIFVPKSQTLNATSGSKVLVTITDWSDGKKNPVGAITAVLDGERDNELAMKEILLENGFKLNFSEEALQEAQYLSGDITQEELSKRKDCRDILTMTIDPKDAKDFDDAISIRPLKDGYYEVGVHIADVSHFIRENTALDKDAYANATSVYLPDRVLPMLPEEVSNVLCSLRPQEEKYTFSAIFQINLEGKIKQYWIGRTVIKSDIRLTYEEAQDVIEGGDSPYKDEILTLNTIARKLRAERFENGAINFNSKEVRFELDEKGKPIGIQIKESKEAHQLIEEMMLLANKTVAQFVQKKNVNGQEIPFPYRTHPLPDELKLEQFAAFASRFGYKLDLTNPDTIARTFNEMLLQLQGAPEEHLLSELGIRTMSKAIYTAHNEGHYGLGFDDYCHFTSPIRRYPDVMVHRVIQQILDKNISLDKNMEQKCKHCSDKERKAMEAERSANKYKQVEYMQQFVGEELDAIVSGVRATGFWAETIDQLCEGMVSIDDVAHLDYFDFVEELYALVGRHSGMRFRIGDKVRIRVEAVNLDSRKIDFGFVDKIDDDKKNSSQKLDKGVSKSATSTPKKSSKTTKSSKKKNKE